MQTYEHTCKRCGKTGVCFTSGFVPRSDVPCAKCCRELVEQATRQILAENGEMEIGELLTAVKEKTGLDSIGPLGLDRLGVESFQLELRRWRISTRTLVKADPGPPQAP